jgi:hypothetical protein
MNINISRITNGWILAVQLPTQQGVQQSATHYSEFIDVVAALKELSDQMNAKPPMPTKAAGK